MSLGHDTEMALVGAVELVNTSPAVRGTEGLGDLAALASFVSARDISEVSSLTDSDLVAVHRVRAKLAAILAELADLAELANVASASTAINALIAEAGTTPRLTDHDGYPLHIHYFTPGARLAEHLAADCGMALAHLLTAGEADRVGRCAAPDCHRLLIDFSRNRSRRYCDERTCGNRIHVAAYRQRRRASAG